MLGRGDEDCVDVLSLQDPLVLHDALRPFRLWALGQQLGCVLHSRLDHVGDYGNLDIGTLLQKREHFPTAATTANQPDPHLAR